MYEKCGRSLLFQGLVQNKLQLPKNPGHGTIWEYIVAGNLKSADPIGVIRRVRSCWCLVSFLCLVWHPLPGAPPPPMDFLSLHLCLHLCFIYPSSRSRIYPNKINSFIQKSGKVGFPKKSRIWLKFTYHISLFTENLNGPYETLLWDISQNKSSQNGVFDENSFLAKNAMSKIWGNVVFGGKKSFTGCLHSKTKVLNIIFQ